MKEIISEKTLLPISMIVVIIGGVMWLTTIWAKGEDNSSDIKELKNSFYSDSKAVQEKLDKIQEDISFLKGLLKEKL